MNSFSYEQVPPEVRKFILRYVDSVELVKLLALLHDDPAREWSVEQITAELRSAPLAIEKRLSDLYDRKVLRRNPAPGKHSYLPYDAEVQRQIDELCRYDKGFPYRVIELIYSRREDALREFANAFNFKKDKEG